MEVHECVLEPLCKTCTIGGTIGVILAVLIGLAVVSGVVALIREYFAEIEERISKLEKTTINENE